VIDSKHRARAAAPEVSPGVVTAAACKPKRAPSGVAHVSQKYRA
jgi:hypothetical protein